ncbi:hypothetical protein ACN20G_36945 (plasmid) [Streptomyces sp. BI20]|uniref:hypothetical protein n=1 Tax=Streptomyces sp. BI20 TaxID=3403460 RepID=UPI003C714487
MGQQIDLSGAPQGPAKPGTAVALAKAIDKMPTKQLANTPVLIAQERELLTRCEAALENHRIAYWAAGKALQAIRDGKLFRATHGTFEGYCNELWDITPQYGNQLVRTWRITERLFELARAQGKNSETIVSKKLGIGQARELVSLAEEHGTDAAAHLYLALIQVLGLKLTATVVAGAAAALPASAAGKKKATEEAVLTYLASLETKPQLPAARDPYKLLRRASKELTSDSIAAAMEQDPDGARAMVHTLITALSASAGINVEIKAGITA